MPGKKEKSCDKEAGIHCGVNSANVSGDGGYVRETMSFTMAFAMPSVCAPRES